MAKQNDQSQHTETRQSGAAQPEPQSAVGTLTHEELREFTGDLIR